MKTLKIFAIAAACMALVACTKEQGDSNVTSFKKGQAVTLNVTADASATKVTSALNSDGTTVDFKWEAGDQIKITVGDSSSVFTLVGDAGTSSAHFEGKMPESGTMFDIQYPVEEPDITAQSYTSGEAIPHGMMKLTATGCKIGDATFKIESQNAALRLNLYGTGKTVSKIVVTNTTSSATYTLNISPAVTLSTESTNPTPFFIVVPAEDWNFSAEVFDNAATPASICTLSPSAAQSFVANQILNMPAKEVAEPPVLSGDFSISATQTVKFSKGNLQATYSTSTSSYNWGFAANQWDYSAAGNTTIDAQTDGAVVDLFGWVGASGTLTGDFTKYGISTITAGEPYGNSASDALKSDWADISTLPQVSGREWKTLTGGATGEWNYLLITRKVTVNSESKTSYGEGSVNGVYGLIILPDNWDGSVCSGFKYGDSWWSNVFTESTDPKWSDMEDAGCVFLPAAGSRYGSGLIEVGSIGYYWSSTPCGIYRGCYLLFSENNLGSWYDMGRVYGYSVRLVSAVK